MHVVGVCDHQCLTHATATPYPTQASLHTQKSLTHTQDHPIVSTMKLNICLLLSLGQLAIAGQTLDVRDVETECYTFDAVDDERTLTFNSYSACAEECAPAGKSVLAMRGSACFCLDSLPPDDQKVEASKCDEPCPGYYRHTCELCFAHV